MTVILEIVHDLSFFKYTVSVIKCKGGSVSTQLGLLGRVTLRHCISGVCTPSFFNIMTETDPVSETLCDKKLKTEDSVQSNSNVFC
jgi:hypothetical protein